MNTFLHPYVMCVWGDIPVGLGTGVRTFKPSSKAFQTVGECTNHLHHVHHSGITISISWWLNNPSPLVISLSSWTLITCIPQCSQLMTIRSGVLLKSAVMIQMVHSRTSLRLWKRFCSGCKPNHKLIMGLVQHPLVSYILLLLTFVFSTVEATTSSSLAFTNFTSLGMFTAELLSPMYPNLVLSEKVF